MKKTTTILLMIIILLVIWGLALRPALQDGENSIQTGSGASGDTGNKTDNPVSGDTGNKTDNPVSGDTGNITGNPVNDLLADGSVDRVIDSAKTNTYYINEKGSTVGERILVPDGFERVRTEAGSFGEYLRELPLKPHGSKVMYYNGDSKPGDVHEAVISIDVGERDLQQCADSIIRLRAEYLYGKGLYSQIHFNFTNGFNADYLKWMKGSRIKVSGNNAYWVEQGSASKDYVGFRKYLDVVFAYAGTLSLSKEMTSIPVEQMQPGDVFIYGSTPGHCVIVLDMAENKSTGEKLFILAQGYMPAQEMHILKNPANAAGDPWYPVNFGETLSTPEWEFTKDQLMRFDSDI